MAFSATGLGSITFTTVTSKALPVAAASAQGNLVVIAVAFGAGSSAWSATDDGGNTYTVATTQTYNTTRKLVTLYCANANALTTSNTITVSWTGSASGSMGAATFSGVKTTSPVDVNLNGTAATGTTFSLASGTLQSANELEIGLTGVSNTTGTWTEASGFSTLNAAASGAGENINWAWRAASGTGGDTYAPSWVNSRPYGPAVLTFLGSSSPFTPPPAPNPVRRAPILHDVGAVALALTTAITATAPFTGPEQPNPARPARPPFEALQRPSLALLSGTVTAPFVPPDFPNPQRPRPAVQDVGQDAVPPLLIGALASPTPFFGSVQANPVRRAPAVQDVGQDAIPPLLSTVTPPKPFTQTDQPNPLFRRPQQPQDIQRSRALISAIVAAPFRQSDWPNPVRLRPAPRFGEGAPGLTLLTTAVDEDERFTGRSAARVIAFTGAGSAATWAASGTQPWRGGTLDLTVDGVAALSADGTLDLAVQQAQAWSGTSAAATNPETDAD